VRDLEHLTRKGQAPARVATRARLILLLHRAETDRRPAYVLATLEHVAEAASVSVATVCRWRLRYLERGIAGLSDRPQSRRGRGLAAEQVAEVEALITRGGATTREIARAVGVSQASVVRIKQRQRRRSGRTFESR
jgi:transposase